MSMSDDARRQYMYGTADTGPYAKSGPGQSDEPFGQRKAAYQMVRTAVLASTRGLPGDLTARVQRLVGKTDVAAIAAVDGALSLLPRKSYNDRLPAYMQQTPTQWATHVSATIQAKREMASGPYGLQGASDEAASIVSAALAAAVPSQPTFADDYDVRAARDDVRAVLVAAGAGANAKAATMLQDALSSNDDLGVYVLVGPESSRFLRAAGVNLDALRKTYALAKSGVSAGQSFQPYAMSARYTPGLQFIVAQEDAGSSLAGLIAAAQTCSDQGISAVEQMMLAGQL